jgi:V8-like Glu-specific endopeptidase
VAVGALTAGVCLAALVSMSAALAAGGSPRTGGPSTAVVHQISATDQRATLAYWTKARMLAAAPRAVPQFASSALKPPPGIPTATVFAGVPTVGALFYTTGGRAHYCTASVVHSAAGDLAFTAAHCVYQKTFVTNIEFVPGYHNGVLPFGAWTIQTIWVRPEWKASLTSVNDDFAFLTIAPSKGKNIQAVTGALTMGFTLWYSQRIEVIGYNDTYKNPVRCATQSFRFVLPTKPQLHQMQFNCHGFRDGVSGGPWIIGYNAKTGTGTVFGDIGGYQQGGALEWTSYSPYISSDARSLYTQATKPAPPPTPTPTPTKTVTAPPAPPALPAPPAPAVANGALQDLRPVHLAKRVGDQF